MVDNDNHITAEGKTDGELADLLLPRIAKNRAMEKTLVTINESMVCSIERGWESEVLRRDANTLTATNLNEFEAAVANDDKETVLLPKESKITLSLMKPILNRSVYKKTIIWEY